MRSPIQIIIISLLFVSVMCIGCSGVQSPMVPDQFIRSSLAFENGSWPIWQSGTPTQKYQNIDLSVLEWGPYPALGQEIGYPVQKEYDSEDRFWTIAVTIEQNYGGDPAIKYAWLDDIDNPDGGPPIASGSMYSVDGDDYEIAAAKVSASHYNYGDQYIEASVANGAFLSCARCMVKGISWRS